MQAKKSATRASRSRLASSYASAATGPRGTWPLQKLFEDELCPCSSKGTGLPPIIRQAVEVLRAAKLVRRQLLQAGQVPRGRVGAEASLDAKRDLLRARLPLFFACLRRSQALRAFDK